MGKHARRRQSRLGARVAGTTGALAVVLSAGVGSAAAAGKSTGTPMTAAAALDDVAQAPHQAAALDAPPPRASWLSLPRPGATVSERSTSTCATRHAWIRGCPDSSAS